VPNEVRSVWQGVRLLILVLLKFTIPVTGIEPISYEDVGFAEPAAVSAVTISAVTILEGPVTDGR
jgi:hypothetical protein